MPPRRCKSRLQRTLNAGPTLKKKKEHAGWKYWVLWSYTLQRQWEGFLGNDPVVFSSQEPGGRRLRYVRGSARYGEPHAPEAHVMEPLADDHSSDSDDAPTGVEESAAPAAPAVAAAPNKTAMSLCLRGCKQSVSYTGAHHHHDSTLPLCRSQNELDVTSARVHVRVCCFHVHPFHLCLCCVHLSSRISPVPSLALRIGLKDQCDGNQCCPAGTTQEWSLRLNVPQHGETHQVLTHSKN